MIANKLHLDYSRNFFYICKLRVMTGRQFSAIVAIDIQ